MAETRETATRLLNDLQRDLGLTREQAAGVVGNLMHESGGFNSLQEISPMVPGSRGGYGYAQWTGPRRKAFEDFAQSNDLDPTSYEANYGFLRHELENDPYERGQFFKVKNAATAEEAARVISENYLRPGIPHMDSRINYATQVLGYNGDPPPSPRTRLPTIGPAGGPALDAINRAAPKDPPPKPAGIFRSAWSGITSGVGGLKQAAGEKVRGIMGSPPPHVQKQIMNMAMGSLPVRTAFVRSLMNQNIGSAPTARQGNVPGGSRVSAVGPNGVSPMTLMGPTNAGSQAFDQSVHAGQDMNVYRANRAAIGGPITQSSINNALSEGRTLYKSR